MKRLILLTLLFTVALASGARAQTWEEYFKQKKTQRKYLLRQIAELQIYLGYLKKGYTIAREGLYTIESIKDGEWNLHKVFFGSLKIVNPKIRHYAKVAAIIDNQRRTLKIFQKGYADARASQQYTGTELDHHYKVFNRVLDATEENVKQLVSVTTNSELQMSDDERIAAIDKLYDESQRLRTFMSKLSDNIRLQAIGKARELDRSATLKILHGIKK